MQGTIHAYTSYTLNTFKQIAEANVDKVTLEFRVKVDGLHYIPKGMVDANRKIAMECSYPKSIPTKKHPFPGRKLGLLGRSQ